MQNAVFKTPVVVRADSAGCIHAKSMSGQRLMSPPCNRVCTGLHLQDRFGCTWKKVHAGQHLYQQGDPLHSIFVVRSGTFKSTLTLMDGSTRICAFPATGDVIALDGLGTSTGGTTVTALDDAHVCAIARVPFDQGTNADTEVQGRLTRLMSEEIMRAQKVLVLMGGSSAQDRTGVFLMYLSRQQRARGYSGRDFLLRMTRSDIGSFLGMALETVSRSFAGIQAQGAIEITGRRVRISDLDAFSRRYGGWQ